MERNRAGLARTMSLARFMLGVGVAISLMSCASMEPSRLVQREFEAITAQPQKVLVASLNEEAVAQVGDPMIAKGRRFTLPAIRLSSPVTHEGVSKGPYEIHLPAGVYVASGRSTWPIKGIFFQYQQPLQFRWSSSGLMRGGSVSVRGGVFVPDLEGGTPQIYWHATDTGVPLTDPEPAIRFERITHEQFQEDSFQQELV